MTIAPKGHTMASETTHETCGCGAEVTFRGDSIYGKTRLQEWRTGHRHVEPEPVVRALVKKTAELDYRAARIDEEAAAMRRDAAKRHLRAARDAQDAALPTVAGVHDTTDNKDQP